MGKGAEQLGVAATEVSEAQMRALFGRGMHPDGGSEVGASTGMGRAATGRPCFQAR